MKTFNELTKKELAELSEMQVEAYIDIELANKKIVKPKNINTSSNPIANAALPRRFVTAVPMPMSNVSLRSRFPPNGAVMMPSTPRPAALNTSINRMHIYQDSVIKSMAATIRGNARLTVYASKACRLSAVAITITIIIATRAAKAMFLIFAQALYRSSLVYLSRSASRRFDICRVSTLPAPLIASTAGHNAHAQPRQTHRICPHLLHCPNHQVFRQTAIRM